MDVTTVDTKSTFIALAKERFTGRPWESTCPVRCASRIEQVRPSENMPRDALSSLYLRSQIDLQSQHEDPGAHQRAQPGKHHSHVMEGSMA